MALSSLDKIRQIRKGMGNPAVGEITDGDLAIYLHLAMKQLATIYEFESLSTYEDIVLDGSTDYTLTATDVLRLIEPPSNLTGNHPMMLMDMRWDRQIGQYASSGTPYWLVPISYQVGICKVRFRPVGTGITVRVPYIKVPTVPGHTTTPDTENFSDLPESFDTTEIARAISIGLEMSFQVRAAGESLQLAGVHEGGASRAMAKSYKHYYLQTATQRLLGRKRGK